MNKINLLLIATWFVLVVGCVGVTEYNEEDQAPGISMTSGPTEHDFSPMEQDSYSNEGQAPTTLGGCGLQNHIGTGSCYLSCQDNGICLAEKSWKCTAVNYEHWRSCWPFGCVDAYMKRPESATVYKCAYINPQNCPWFCNAN